MVSGLLVATKSRHADAKATISGFSNWFSSLPVPDSIQCDNGSHFTSVMVQDWAKRDGIKGVFHTPYYPQANWIVEHANGLLKHYLRPHKSGWDKRLPSVLYQINN